MRRFLVPLCSLWLVACGGPAASTPTSDTPKSGAPAPSAEPTAQPSTSSPEPEASAAPTATAKADDPGKPTGLTEEKLRKAKALEEPFPEIESVTKELGAATASGPAPRREWLYDSHPLGKTFACSTIDLVRTPQGAFVVDESAYTGDECKKVKRTKAQVEQATAAIEGKRFDEATKLFEKQLGKPENGEEMPLAAWRYVDDSGECRLLLVTSHLGSHAGQALWGAPCD